MSAPTPDRIQALELALVERTRAKGAVHDALTKLEEASRAHHPTGDLEHLARACLERLDRAVANVQALLDTDPVPA